MPTTYNLIKTYSLTGTQASVTFSSIPQIYDDLVLHISARCNTSGTFQGVYLKFNGETSLTADKSSLLLYGSGSGSAGFTNLNGCFVGDLAGNTAPANFFAASETYFGLYRSSNTYKTFASNSITMNASGSSFLESGVLSWTSNGSALTSIEVVPSSNSFIQHSTFSLYGISNS